MKMNLTLVQSVYLNLHLLTFMTAYGTVTLPILPTGSDRSPQLSRKPVDGASDYVIYMIDTGAGNRVHLKSVSKAETLLHTALSQVHILMVTDNITGG